METSANELNKQVYRVTGFTCTGCAAKFEQNVRKLPGVADAKVNFGAAKISVYGEATIPELEKAGAFEGLKITPDSLRSPEVLTGGSSFRGRYTAWIRHALCIVGLIMGWLAHEGSYLSILSFTAVIIIGGYSLFKQGLLSLLKLDFNMNTLMTIAILGAAAIGEWGEGAVIVLLFSISEALERSSMDRARRSIRSLMDTAPRKATIRRNGAEAVVDVEDVAVGDLLIVKPGEKIAMDGSIVSGHSTVNQAAITGESMPAHKGAGDEVFAGTLNEEGLLEIEVTKRTEDTTIAKIIHLVEEAQAEKAPSQAFVDRFARYYTPAIMLIALLTVTVPPLFLQASWNEWLYRGLALLVVGCPCALVISTPVAIVTAIGSAARNGVLIKGGIHLETAGRVEIAAFDKTGTLTRGMPVLTDVIPLQGISADEALRIAAALESGSKHPLADAIITEAAAKGLSEPRCELADFRSVTGQGIAASVNGTMYRIGKPGWFASAEDNVQALVLSLQEQGKTVMLLGDDSTELAVLAAADEIRSEAESAVQVLRRAGIQRTLMLTGDHGNTAAEIGRQAGIDEVLANLMPEDKLRHVRRLRGEGRVAMIGDGVNDAPALAAADIGIAMGASGSDAALETADIALMGDDLSKLGYAMKLSWRTLAIIKQNVAISLGLKLLALLLIMPGWLTLWMAVFADMGATLIVTFNALRLTYIRQK